MSEISLETAVGDLVRENLGRSRVFERHGIDYCCGGSRSLDQACRIAHVDLHLHIHLENNVLFPRAVELEMELATADAQR